jgi:hypothetical protein
MTGRDGNATRRTESADSRGRTAFTSTIKGPSIMHSHHRRTSVRWNYSSKGLRANLFPDWISKNISYGLYLSDHSILTDVETELTVLGGIMIQNLPRETGWHLRGTRRIGVSKEDVETIQQCVSFLILRASSQDAKLA